MKRTTLCPLSPHVSRYDTCMVTSHRHYLSVDATENTAKANVIKELLFLKYYQDLSVESFILTRDEIDFMITSLCCD